MTTEKTDWHSVVHEPHQLLTMYPVAYDLELCVFGCKIRVQCLDDYVHSLLIANYGSCHGKGKDVHLRYFIRRARHSTGFTITRNGVYTLFAGDDGDLLSLLEEDLTINLQIRKSRLYFLHAAAVEFAGRALLLVAPSGGGKSTTTWGLLHEGFGYMSDELAPIHLDTMKVYPYPHAICLKSGPPSPYTLPDRAVRTSRTIHIPAQYAPSRLQRAALRLAGVCFLQRGCENSASSIVPVSRGEAAARLYANGLNALAHKGEGLDGAAKIANKSICLRLTIGNLSEACALMRNTLKNSFGPEP